MLRPAVRVAGGGRRLRGMRRAFARAAACGVLLWSGSACSGSGDGSGGAPGAEAEAARSAAAAVAESPPAASPMGLTEAAGPERRRVLGPFLDRHWLLPVPAQGPPPPGWSEVEVSLEPEACGTCHPAQLAQWGTSLHAAAFSPGFAGQLIEGPLAEKAEVRQCQTCHAPLAEQLGDEALRRRGVVCAACHVRAHRRFGPPRRAELPPLPDRLPHGGFEQRPEFLESRFCAPCHQFFDDAGIAGKPIENTWTEWKASPHAARGETCQSCHMPDRAHLWRGIHDPDMVRRAVAVELVPSEATGAGEVAASLVVASFGVGHAFPTYVTPRVFLRVVQEDGSGRELPGSEVEAVVGREIDFASSTEVFDTRIAPGASVRLDYRKPRAPGAAALVGRVRVEPDHHYRGVFESLLREYEDPEARRLISEALERARRSAYELAERRLELPAAPEAGGSGG